MADTLSLQWTEWKLENAEKLAHVAGFEAEFVDRILSRIPEIEPADVTAQHEFIDESGRTRRVDFAIRNRADGSNLMIELDGASKDTDSARWKDFLARQNSVVLRYGAILRFSNRCMFDRPAEVVATIRRGLTSGIKTPGGFENHLGAGSDSVYIGRKMFEGHSCCADCGGRIADHWRRPDGETTFSCAHCG